MTGIIGSGFGLYGYMPAVLLEDEQVFLLENAKEKFLKRDELLCFEQRIFWARDLKIFLSSIDTLIISLPPHEQEKLLETVLSYDNIKNMILEKPVAASPKASLQVLQSIFLKEKNLRINYTFLEAIWFKEVEQIIKAYTDTQLSISIQWHFNAHHFRNNVDTWKKNHNDGGGAIRFYGIHFIALAAHLNFFKITYSNTNNAIISNWSCRLLNNDSNLMIDIDTNSENQLFSVNVKSNKKELFSYKSIDPFDDIQKVNASLDKRITGLRYLYSNLKSTNITTELFNYYQETNRLWLSIENALVAPF